MEDENNLLDMPDEEFANFDFTSLEEENLSEESEGKLDEEQSEEDEGEAPEESDESHDDAETDSTDSEEEESEEEENPSEDEEQTDSIDPSEQLAKLFAPFKANGQEINVDTVEEAITLMQQGANYSKKMSAIKPVLRVAKMLENNDLMDENKLNHLIEVSKGNPEAIAKLLADAKLDPMELDVDNTATYKPDTYAVTDSQLELDQVIEDLQSSPSGNQALLLVANEWDEDSKQIFATQPKAFKVLQSHMEQGIFEQVSKAVAKERALGRLQGLSDFEAYKVTGDKIFANAKPAPQQKGDDLASKIKNAVNPKAKDPNIARKKKAAGIPKGKPAARIDPDFNPLSMSDEEFEKFEAQNSKYL